VCLLRHGGNTKETKTISLKEKLNRTLTNRWRLVGTTWITSIKSKDNSQNCHVTEENENQCGKYKITFFCRSKHIAYSVQKLPEYLTNDFNLHLVTVCF
jgi:hypothetical protein